MKNKRVLKNMLSSVLSYGALLIFSIITSRIVLVGYGSESNGLLSSVNQLFSYIALLEAGIGTATVRALYHPLSEKKTDGIVNVLAASRSYYRISAMWYFSCVVVVSFVWPLIIDTTIHYWTVWSVIFFQGIAGVITYWYTSTIVNYLVASGKNYINNNVHMLATVLTYGLKLVICFAGWNISFISVSLVIVNLVKCFIYHRCMRQYCPEFFVRRKADLSLLKQRRAFLIHEISGAIFSSADTVIISVFCGLKEASIYAVYAMVLSALKNIIGQAFNGTKYVLGNGYVDGRKGYIRTHELYNSIYICLSFIVFTVAYLLLIPFVGLYTSGVTDANYLDPKLPLLFVMIELLSSCRIVDNEVIRIALHAKQTISRTITESLINLVVSLVLVQYMGIYGVLIGTILALFYRANDVILYVNHRILHRSAKKEYGLYLANFGVFALCTLLESIYAVKADSYTQLLVQAVVTSVIVLVAYLTVNLLISEPLRTFMRGYIKRIVPSN